MCFFLEITLKTTSSVLCPAGRSSSHATHSSFHPKSCACVFNLTKIQICHTHFGICPKGIPQWPNVMAENGHWHFRLGIKGTHPHLCVLKSFEGISDKIKNLCQIFENFKRWMALFSCHGIHALWLSSIGHPQYTLGQPPLYTSSLDQLTKGLRPRQHWRRRTGLGSKSAICIAQYYLCHLQMHLPKNTQSAHFSNELAKVQLYGFSFGSPFEEYATHLQELNTPSINVFFYLVMFNAF
jgi:hypothetical protein